MDETEPPAEPAPEPAAEPAPEPATEPASEPAVEPAAEPATEPAAEPAPSIADDAVKVIIDPDQGDQHPHSIQVPTDAKLTLQWTSANASKVTIDPLGDQDASGSIDLPASDATYSLIAKNDAGEESQPFTLEVHTHEPGEVVSPHVMLSSGIAAILSFICDATTDVLELVVTDATESATINDQAVDLTPTGDGNLRGTLQAEPGETYVANALQDGEVKATAQISAEEGSLGETAFGASEYTHGQPIEISVTALGAPEGKTVFFAIEQDEDDSGNWTFVKQVQAPVTSGRAAISTTLEDDSDEQSGDHSHAFRFRASFESMAAAA